MLLPYLRKADTTAMLSPYLKESDTVWLSNRINLKVNISDTGTMLSPYLRDADTTSMLTAYLRKGDTASMLSPYLKESDTTFLSNRINLKVNISDTSSMLGNYIRHAGNGLTKSGQALSVDTSAIATRARVQKGIDSVASIASGNISGTLTTNYIPKATGTSSIGNSIAYDNGTEILLNTTSDVGDYKLQSNGNIYTKGKIDISSNDPAGLNVYRLTSSEVYAQVFNTTGWAFMGAERSTGGGLVPNSRPNAAIFASGYVAPIQFAIDTNIRATIDTFGNVGIGVLPTERLHVNGRIRAATIDSIASPINMLTADVNGVIKKSAISTGTVTSVATGYGLSGGTITTTGTIIADTALLASRLRVGKVVDSLSLVKQNVLTNPVTGTGTTNYVPKFTGTSTVGNSQIFDNATSVGIGTTTPSAIALVDMYKTANDQVVATIRNPNTGASAYTEFQIKSTNTDNNGLRLMSMGTNYSTTGGFVQKAAVINADLDLTGGMSIMTRANAPIRFYTNGFSNERARLSESGSLGIGTNNPLLKLHVNDGVNAEAGARIENGTRGTSSSSILQIISSAGGGTLAMSSIANTSASLGGRGNTFALLNNLTDSTSGGIAILARNANDYISFHTGGDAQRGIINAGGEFILNNLGTDAGDYKLQVSGNAYVTGTTILAASSGNVGIGTASPGYKLQIGSNFAVTNNGELLWGNALTGTSRGVLSWDTDLAAIASLGTKLTFSAGSLATNVMVLNNNGELILNTATDNGDFKVQVTGNSYLSGVLAIGTTSANASAKVDITSTTQGFLPPRMTSTQRDAISSPAAGLVIYNTTTSKLQVYTTAWTDLH
jgi:hypothetical protein